MFTGREWNGVTRLVIAPDSVTTIHASDVATYWRAGVCGTRGRGRKQAANWRRACRAFQNFPRG